MRKYGIQKMQNICKCNKVKNMKMHEIWQKIHCHFDFMAVFFWFIQESNKQNSGTENLHTL